MQAAAIFDSCASCCKVVARWWYVCIKKEKEKKNTGFQVLPDFEIQMSGSVSTYPQNIVPVFSWRVATNIIISGKCCKISL